MIRRSWPCGIPHSDFALRRRRRRITRALILADRAVDSREIERRVGVCVWHELNPPGHDQDARGPFSGRSEDDELGGLKQRHAERQRGGRCQSFCVSCGSRVEERLIGLPPSRFPDTPIVVEKPATVPCVVTAADRCSRTRHCVPRATRARGTEERRTLTYLSSGSDRPCGHPTRGRRAPEK